MKDGTLGSAGCSRERMVPVFPIPDTQRLQNRPLCSLIPCLRRHSPDCIPMHYHQLLTVAGTIDSFSVEPLSDSKVALPDLQPLGALGKVRLLPPSSSLQALKLSHAVNCHFPFTRVPDCGLFDIYLVQHRTPDSSSQLTPVAKC